MATRFQIKRSTTPASAPTTSDIEAGELAINLADQKLYSSNGTGIFEIGAGGTGNPDGSNTEIQYNNSGSFGSSSSLKYDGSRLIIGTASSNLFLYTAGYIYLQNSAYTNFISPNTITLGGIYGDSYLKNTLLAISNTTSNVYLHSYQLDMQMDATTNAVINSSGYFFNGVALPPPIMINAFSTSDTWTKPSVGTYAFVQIWGAGGSGGGNAGGGGGGGSYKEAWFHLSTLGSTEPVTIGVGGAASNASNSGSPGGYSSFYNLYAYGGSGGTTGAAGLGGHGGSPYDAPHSNNAYFTSIAQSSKPPTANLFVSYGGCLVSSINAVYHSEGGGRSGWSNAGIAGILGFGGGGGGKLNGFGGIGYDNAAAGGGAGRSTGIIAIGGSTVGLGGGGGDGGNNSVLPTAGSVPGGGGGGGSANATLGRESAGGANGYVVVSVF